MRATSNFGTQMMVPPKDVMYVSMSVNSVNEQSYVGNHLDQAFSMLDLASTIQGMHFGISYTITFENKSGFTVFKSL